jgi:antitoxin CcdA
MMEKPEDAAVPSQNADARRCWLDENASAFAAQARWHERHPHPFEDILVDPKPTCS